MIKYSFPSNEVQGPCFISETICSANACNAAGAAIGKTVVHPIPVTNFCLHAVSVSGEFEMCRQQNCCQCLARMLGCRWIAFDYAFMACRVWYSITTWISSPNAVKKNNRACCDLEFGRWEELWWNDVATFLKFAWIDWNEWYLQIGSDHFLIIVGYCVVGCPRKPTWYADTKVINIIGHLVASWFLNQKIGYGLVIENIWISGGLLW